LPQNKTLFIAGDEKDLNDDGSWDGKLEKDIALSPIILRKERDREQSI
jgi:hypothetical protein